MDNFLVEDFNEMKMEYSPYDNNSVNMSDFTGLKIVDGLIVPHCNRKEEFINNLKNKTKERLYY